MKLKHELVYTISVFLVLIVSVLYVKAVWESGLPDWLKILILR